MIRFPPHFGDSLSFPLKGKRHQPDQPKFLVLESTVCSTFPPPPQIPVIRFAHPLSRCPILSIGRQRAGAFKNARIEENAFEHSYTVECGNHLRVGVRAKKR